MIWSLFHRKRRTDSIVYGFQEEHGEPGLVEPESNNKDRGSDLLDVCVRFPFEASPVELPSSTPAPLFDYDEVGHHYIFLFPY